MEDLVFLKNCTITYIKRIKKKIRHDIHTPRSVFFLDNVIVIKLEDEKELFIDTFQMTYDLLDRKN